MTASELEQFTAWIEDLIRARGYDIDSPRGGGKSRLADEAGVHRAAITRLLQGQSMPDLETTRRLAHVLRVPVREMLIRSGRLSEEDLPLPDLQDSSPGAGAPAHRLTLEEAAAGLGVPPDQWDMFIKVAGQFLPAAAADVRPERAAAARGGSPAVKNARKG
ncbi:transcriptional regulator [Streptomyces agglomeratus]|uniref:Transcriptional regulator n=1 Tax=Streptomyces agglomeratus TaxID=285458 RepID=A0A1E5P7P9_9ACTN|nr:helix-turn-helix transcriptional regulator [Streptomyces agglomeratus]OEJ25545.1 transcriptional regulator [Streptomyces agglomeratus]OEJ40417.1 transcriptional regulator [Streptomyces agglomeratus]OEJ45205.1 transcriptional regulator [Streptomyces agglomeratus]OEJ52968.1 transcriptional regulator [Streptomyces agglomeratus]OEJ60304.1 transcriptional regulator [Streptomyces agglomeratus]